MDRESAVGHGERHQKTHAVLHQEVPIKHTNRLKNLYQNGRNNQKLRKHSHRRNLQQATRAMII
jgi:hypothetical protein